MRDASWLPERLLGAAMAGSLALGGGLFMLDFKALRALPLGDRQLAALARAVIFSLVLAGVSAGWLAAGLSERTMLPLETACAGSFLTPVLAWFLGFSPPWPLCWAAAAGLGFLESWAGLGLGLFLTRRRFG
ncbi:MAG: hypothetical protein IMW96_05140 [Thermoanaerobacteraceae bacterium]|nr:hypothetical protein [Thermoanaerobacteraceae bacterium]